VTGSRAHFLILIAGILLSLTGCNPHPEPCAPGTIDLDGASANGCECTVSAEICDLNDNDCDGAVDEGVQSLFYQDQDGDGFGGTSLIQACEAPTGFASRSGDCQDFNPAIHPEAAEICNQGDDNCNGQADEGVATQALYWDNDGDGFAAPHASTRQACQASTGWVPAKDADQDGEPDWDCNDADTTTYPGASEVCGDGRDNSCSGYVDRICYRACTGRWPFRLAHSRATISVRSVDLNGDGLHEVILNEDFGFALLKHDGSPLYEYSAPDHNYSRASSVVADIDDYDRYGPTIQTLEILSANGSTPRYYKLLADGLVTSYVTSPQVEAYDASDFLVSDLDRDGKVEFLTSTWCRADNVGTKIFRFNRETQTIELAGSVADPQNKCQYDAGRLLTDLDGDGLTEFVFGNGYAYATLPSYWSGNLFAYRIHPTTFGVQPYCSGGVCFTTAITGLYTAEVNKLIRFGSSLRTSTWHYTSNTPDTINPITARYWEYNLSGVPSPDSPSQTNNSWRGLTDVDRNGVPEDIVEAASVGLFDINGDGYPDRLHASGSMLLVSLWDPVSRSFVENVSSRARLSNTGLTLRSLWDLDADGQIDVLASDESGNIYCQELGLDTWNKLSSVPPMPIHLKTNQWDNYEPNEGTDRNGDGLPDEMIRIPSALTVKGDFYGYLSSASDKDYYVIDAGYAASICVTAPAGHSYTLKIYSLADLWNNESHAPVRDGRSDGLVWTDTSTSQTKCFHGSNVHPPRYVEYRIIVGIESQDGSFSNHWPYWISAPK
jgi:hypothetical protein